MSVPTQQPREIYLRIPQTGGLRYTPEPSQWTYFVRSSMVPRLFKAALGGAASRDGHGYPYDMSGGFGMGHLPHLAYQLTIPDRRAGLTAEGDALRTHSTQRIPPVLVRTRLR